MPSSSSPPWLPFLLLAISVGSIALLGPHREALGPALLPWGVGWLALLHLWRNHGAWLDRPRVVLAGAILLRLLLLPSLPDLSDDLYRYVWDGWLASHGISPFGLTPSDPRLAPFHPSVPFREMNSPDYHSIYPPLSQLVFLAGGWIQELRGWPASAYAVKAGFLLLETLGVLLLVRSRQRSGAPVRTTVLYAWNPLVLLVVAGGGHTEGGLVLGLALLLAGTAAGHPMAAWTGWVLAVLSKGFPLILAPLVWRALRKRAPARAVTAGAALPLAAAAVLTLLFLRPGELVGVAESARLYVQLFEFNAGLYTLLTEGARLLTGEGWGHRIGPGLAALFLVGGSWLALRHPVEGVGQVARGVLLIHSLHLVTATTVHPWYLLWVLPLLPFTGVLREAWLWASAAALPTYLTYVGVPHLPLTALFWGGWALLALHGEREGVLRPLRRWAAGRKLSWILPHLEGARILDVGGAEGALGRAVAGAGFQVVLLDPVPGAGGLPRIRGEGERLPLRRGSVDTVLLSFVLHHSRDPDRVLREAFRVAGRRVVILESTHRGHLEGWALERLDRWVNARRGSGGEERPAPEPIRYRSPEAWERAVREAGGRVRLSDRPNRVGHRVHRLVAEAAGMGAVDGKAQTGCPKRP